MSAKKLLSRADAASQIIKEIGAGNRLPLNDLIGMVEDAVVQSGSKANPQLSGQHVRKLLKAAEGLGVVRIHTVVEYVK